MPSCPDPAVEPDAAIAAVRHLHRLRNRLGPQHFHALWGQSAANLAAVLAERSEAEIAVARKQIALGEAGLHLPLSSNTEFDR